MPYGGRGLVYPEQGCKRSSQVHRLNAPMVNAWRKRRTIEAQRHMPVIGKRCEVCCSRASLQSHLEGCRNHAHIPSAIRRVAMCHEVAKLCMRQVTVCQLQPCVTAIEDRARRQL